MGGVNKGETREREGTEEAVKSEKVGGMRTNSREETELIEEEEAEKERLSTLEKWEYEWKMREKKIGEII